MRRVTSRLDATVPTLSRITGVPEDVTRVTLTRRGFDLGRVGPVSAEAQAYHKSAAALSGFAKTGLTDIEDIVPWIRMMVSDGWWMTGQTILVNGGYTTK